MRFRRAPLRSAWIGGPNPWLLGGEALAGVQPDALAVEHRVLDDSQRELGELLRLAESLRECGVLGERLGELVGDTFGQSRGEQARRDRQHADAQAAKIA